MSLYWRSFEERPIIELTLRFLPLTVAGVAANVVGSFLVGYIVRHLPRSFSSSWPRLTIYKYSPVKRYFSLDVRLPRFQPFYLPPVQQV